MIAVTNRHICYEAHKSLLEDANDTDKLGIYMPYCAGISETERDKCALLLRQIDLLSAKPDVNRIILREKDLSYADYRQLAKAACRFAPIEKLAFHYYYELLDDEEFDSKLTLHLPLWRLEEYIDGKDDKSRNSEKKPLLYSEKQANIGVSVHSVEETIRAKELGAAYIIAGNIYETECKAGLPGRGLEFLRKVAFAVDIPVYAIGGITPQRLDEVKSVGANDGCMMSTYMKQ